MDEILITQTGQRCLIKAHGTFDLRLSTMMREEMARKLHDGKTNEIIVDLAGITHIDSLGVGMLVSAYQSAQTRNMDFALVQVPEKAAELLHITRLDAILPIFSSAEVAIKTFGSGKDGLKDDDPGQTD